MVVLGIYHLFNCNWWVEIASFWRTLWPVTKKFDGTNLRKQYDRQSDALFLSKNCLICYVMVKVVFETYLVFNLNECLILVGSKTCLLFFGGGSGNLPIFNCNGGIVRASSCIIISPKTIKVDSASHTYDKLFDASVCWKFANCFLLRYRLFS